MRSFVTRCVEEARGRGTSTVEAEHVVLAVLRDTSDPLAVVLAESGLTYDVMVDALREERTRSLVFAGVDPIDAQALKAARRVMKPLWGASVSAARGREPAAGRGVRSQRTAVLIGIFRADLGTVPRVLAVAGIDRPALIARLRTLS